VAEAGRALARQEQEKAPEIVNVELNLEEPPLFGGRVSVGKNGYREYVQEYRKADGSVGQRMWRWRPPEEYGELEVFDGDVYLAMHALAKEKLGGIPEDGKIPFTLYEVLNILGLKDNGKNYRRVRDSILKINKTLMDAIDAFYREDKKAYGSAHFIPWRVEFEANEDRYGRATERHKLRFDEILVRSLAHGHIKQLDLSFCLSLTKGYAKSLYRRIDYKRGDSFTWSEDIMVLKDHIGMPASYKQPSKVKEKLEPSHKEMKDRGFLAAVVYEGNRVHYRVAEEFVSARSYLDRSWGPEESGVYRALLRNGVWPNVARTLIHEQGAAACRFYVEALPYQKNIRSPGAWLKKYIGERLPLPIEPPQRRLHEADVAPVESAERRSNGDGQEEETMLYEPHQEATRIWEDVLERVADRIDDSSRRVWFEGVCAVGLESDALIVAVPNAFAEEYITTRFKEIVDEGLRSLLSPPAEMRLVIGKVAPLT
jgi:Replication initiator protein A/DnaA N-terminal domain